MAQQWHNTKDQLPPEGRIVDTISEGGLGQKLKRQGKLWFFPDGSMYVYYAVAKWAYLEGQDA